MVIADNKMTTATGQLPSNQNTFVQALVLWYRPDRRPYPWRESKDLYFVTVCELLLQRTNAEKVLPVVQELFEKFPSADSLANGNSGQVATILRPLGLQKRVCQVINIAQMFAKWGRDGHIVDTQTLMKLPGIGPYSSAAISVLALGRREALIDEHALRILQRVFDLPIHPRRHPTKATKEFATALVPSQAREYNLGLLDLGRLVCRPRRPCCLNCPVTEVCNYALQQRDDHA